MVFVLKRWTRTTPLRNDGLHTAADGYIHNIILRNLNSGNALVYSGSVFASFFSELEA